MKVYRIYYKDSEGIITQYDKVNYVSRSSAEKIMNDAKEQFPNNEFKIYEIEVK